MIACPMLQGRFVSPMRAALSTRVSIHDQPTLREFATRRQWTVTDAVKEIASGATD